MKESKVEKFLASVAIATSKSASLIFLYEPKMPEKLVKKNKKKEQ